MDYKHFYKIRLQEWRDFKSGNMVIGIQDDDLTKAFHAKEVQFGPANPDDAREILLYSHSPLERFKDNTLAADEHKSLYEQWQPKNISTPESIEIASKGKL